MPEKDWLGLVALFFLFLGVAGIGWLLWNQNAALAGRVAGLESERVELQIKWALSDAKEQDAAKQIDYLQSQIEDFQKQDFETRINTQAAIDSLKSDVLVLKARAGQGAPWTGGSLTINQYQYSGDWNR